MSLGVPPLEIVAKGTHPLLAAADHWQRVFLSEVADVQNGFAFRSAYFHPDNGVPLVRIRDIANEETEHRYFGDFDDQYLIERGDILIGMDGDFAVSRWKGGKALLNQRVCKIRLTSDRFDERFLFLCLQPFLDAINAETSSVTVKHLSSRTVEEIPLPLPPLSEQRRIVAKIEELLSELDKGIESLKTARRQLEVYRQSVLKHAFEGKLTAQWREKNKDKLDEPERLLARIEQEREAYYEVQLEEWQIAVAKRGDSAKRGGRPRKPSLPHRTTASSSDSSAEGNGLPVSWTSAAIGSLFDVVSGATPKGLEHVEGSDLPFYKVSDMNSLGNETRMDAAAMYLSEARRSELGLTVHPAGTVIFPKRGGAILTNKKRLMSRPACFDLNTMGVINRTATVSTDYLWHWFQSLDLCEIYDGSNVPQINNGDIEPLWFPICSGQEQNEIVRVLDKVLSVTDQMESEIDKELSKAEALRHVILKKAFAGQLVAQDPSDEPASVLLEKIRLERAQASENGAPVRKARKTKTVS